MSATWTVLGAGTILPRAGYGSAGYALREERGGPVTLFDCGPGTLRALGNAGIELADIRRVVISHFHVDHCLDLFALAFARHIPAFRARHPLEILGPVGLAALLDRGERSLGKLAKDPRADVVEAPLGADGRAALERDGLRLRCVATGHTPEAVAWRAELPSGASVAYSGDTGENPAVAELARGVDLFALECSHPDGEGVPGHLTPSSAARLAALSQCARLLLTHFYPPVDPEAARGIVRRTYHGTIELARDGSVHALG